MLTRLEVNGFKNLVNFSVDFGVFNCIAGLNGVGKSNIFDAIKFLSLLSDKTILDASLAIRDTEFSDPLDIFWTNGEDRSNEISIAVEMIVSQRAIDDYKRSAQAASTFLRYEVKLQYQRDEHARGDYRIFLAHESLNYINKGDAVSKLSFPLSARNFRDKVVLNKRKGAGFISTSSVGGFVEINLHQDGTAGIPQRLPAMNMERTVISNTNSIASPTILAARREMQSWRMLCLEPSAMRRSNKYYDSRQVDASGGCMASTLNRLVEQDISILSRVASRLTRIIPTVDIRVDDDKSRQILTVEVKERAGAYLPARVLSDGTLRFLALCIMAEDNEFRGTLCFEEPENGIHPEKMKSMYELLKSLAVDPFEEISDENVLRQIIIATHSPVMVNLQDPRDLIYADVVKVKTQEGKVTNTIRAKSIRNTWRCENNKVQAIEVGSIVAYLSYSKNSQLNLDLNSVG
ncbi:MAG: AAA family ATPase [Acidovorax sp.]|jgi:predicted ATPase|nr:AAA family ATPase [Acidovorax sp.]